MNQRTIAFEIIYKTISNDQSFTNLLMRNKVNELPKVQRPFVINLVNNVLKNYDFLLYQFSEYINSNTSLKNKIILTMALYEKTYLKEKDYVVVNEYVNLASNKYDKSFINAILHKNIEIKEAQEPWINYSLPEWLYRLLYAQYKEKITDIIQNYQRTPIVYYRINNSKIIKNELKDINFINENIFTSKQSLIDSDLLKNGYIYIQDINSESLYKNLDLNNDDVLLDVCSAPGSKLFNCLDVIKPENAYANDIYEHRVNLIKDKADLLGFKGIHYLNEDGTKLNLILPKIFNKIMLDAPCSGLGTIGHKPDLKFHIKPESLDELQDIQYKLLDSTKDLLLEGGILLYSTCTLNKKENEKQVKKFLELNSNFCLVKDETIINNKGDCFYYAKLYKNV